MEIIIALLAGMFLGSVSAKKSWQVLPLVATVLWVTLQAVVITKMMQPVPAAFEATSVCLFAGLTAYVISMLFTRVGMAKLA